MAERGRRAVSRERRHLGRTGWLVVGGLVVVLLALAGYLGFQARNAQQAIDRATTEASTLQSQLTSGDAEAATQTLRRLQSATADARSSTHGPLWSAAGVFPFVGDSVDAVQTASDALDDIARRGLPPIVETTTAVNSNLFKPKDGKFDVAAFAELAPAVTESSSVLRENRATLASIDADHLLGPLRQPVGDLQQKVRDAAEAATAASKALQVAPTMLGADGDRTYALVFQNNAEARPTGGIPGALALVSVEDGELSFDESLSSSDFVPPFDSDVLERTDDEKLSFPPALARDIRDTTLTPHFPRTGQLVREMVDRKTGTKVDGVISIDPVALSYALRGTGPVELADGSKLTSENAVEMLLNTVYAKYTDPREQDAYFADAAQRVFEKVAAGAGDSTKTLTELARATDENRIMVWSSVEEEEDVLRTSGVGGSFPNSDTRPDVGVYLSDATASKMQYYLDAKTRVTADRCVDGVQTLTVTTTLKSTAPSDAALLPDYIVGSGKRGPLGTMRINVYSWAPKNGEVVRLKINGEQKGLPRTQLYDRPGVQSAVLLEPGKTITFEVTMRSAKGQTGRPLLSVTPGVRPVHNDVSTASACS